MLFTTINPFISDASSDKVVSSVVNFTMDNCDKVSREPNGTMFSWNETNFRHIRRKRSIVSPEDNAIEISLYMAGIEPTRMNESTRDIYKMLYHSVNITDALDPLIVAVYPLPDEFLTVYIHFGEPPSPENYTRSQNVSGTLESSYESSNNTLFISVEEMRNITLENATVNIGIRRQGIVGSVGCKCTLSTILRCLLSPIIYLILYFPNRRSSK